ncbi:MAG: TolC family protein [Planctomycetia bacterium]
MVKTSTPVAPWILLIGLAGCATDLSERRGLHAFGAPATRSKADATAAPPPPAFGVVQAGYSTGDPPSAKNDGSPPPPTLSTEKTSEPSTAPILSLSALIDLTLERNPRLAQVGWAVETARGRAIQAGLHPNPSLSVSGDELGDRTGPGGIWTAPHFQQEIVTADKLGLSKAAALKEVDQAALRAAAERYRLFTEVRQHYFETATLQRRAEIGTELVALAEKSVENAQRLLKAGLNSELDVVQLEVDLERYRADLDAADCALPAAFRRLAASVGVNDLPFAKVVGDLEATLPDYDLDRVRAYVLGIHPELRSAQVGVERARLVLKRAAVEPIPNVTVGAGYVRQNQNRSDDWVVAASLPVPLWNKNQGNILAAKAQVGEAASEVGRVQNDLVGRLASAHGVYAAAKQRAERYRTAVVPKAEQTYQLALKGRKGGEFEYLRVLQAQRALAEARLEHLRSLGEAWRAASDVAGLMLEDEWPTAPPTPAKK